MKFLADLHVHSNFSDGKMSIPELIDFYGKREFGAIAITDHLCESQTAIGKAAGYLNKTLTKAIFPLYIQLLMSESQRAWQEYKLVVIPGVEFTKNSLLNHRSAHILGLGLKEFISADFSVDEIISGLHAQGALAIAAHPVSTRKVEKQTYHLWGRREELKNKLDAWEVASGPHWFHEVQESGLPMIATSDLHTPDQIHAWKTVFNCERHPQAILDAIKKQSLEFFFYDERRSRNVG
jgi:predicted metal-dependent phosphoesterase TrpH